MTKSVAYAITMGCMLILTSCTSSTQSTNTAVEDPNSLPTAAAQQPANTQAANTNTAYADPYSSGQPGNSAPTTGSQPMQITSRVVPATPAPEVPAAPTAAASPVSTVAPTPEPKKAEKPVQTPNPSVPSSEEIRKMMNFPPKKDEGAPLMKNSNSETPMMMKKKPGSQ